MQTSILMTMKSKVISIISTVLSDSRNLLLDTYLYTKVRQFRELYNENMSRGGTEKIEKRLKSKIKSGEYYEAHQIVRTIFARQK